MTLITQSTRQYLNRNANMLKLITTACAICFHIACAAQTPNEYTEERVDVTGFFKELNAKALTTTPGTNSALSVLDFSQYNDVKNLSYTLRAYGDSIVERHGDNEVEWFACDGGTKRLKGIFSRICTLDFRQGLPYRSSDNNTREITGSDTLTIIHANGEARSYAINVEYSIRSGGTVIPAVGDTIRETSVHTTRYSFAISDDPTDNRTASYTNTRWEADDRDFPVVEWTRYTGWNGDIESATLSAETARSAKKQAKETNESRQSFAPNLEMLVITDISGKTYRKYTAEEAACTTDYGLPPGWYIFTEHYPDRSISTKKYIDRN